MPVIERMLTMWPDPRARIPGQHRLDHVHRAEEVRVEQRSHLVVVALLDGGEVAVARVVDEHVEAAERGVGRGDCAAIWARSVTSSATASARSPTRRRSPAPPRGGARSPPPSAPLPARRGDGAADPGRASGDEPAPMLSRPPAAAGGTPRAGRRVRSPVRGGHAAQVGHLSRSVQLHHLPARAEVLVGRWPRGTRPSAA